MEKISGIIPSSARVSSVDLKDSHPVRPGVPTFGRPIGRSGVDHSINRSSIDTLMERPMTDRERVQMEKAKIIDDISSGFFMKPKPAPVANPAVTVDFQYRDAYSDPVQASPEVLYADDAMGADATTPGATDAAAEPEYLMPGSYIDVTV